MENNQKKQKPMLSPQSLVCISMLMLGAYLVGWGVKLTLLSSESPGYWSYFTLFLGVVNLILFSVALVNNRRREKEIWGNIRRAENPKGPQG